MISIRFLPNSSFGLYNSCNGIPSGYNIFMTVIIIFSFIFLYEPIQFNSSKVNCHFIRHSLRNYSSYFEFYSLNIIYVHLLCIMFRSNLIYEDSSRQINHTSLLLNKINCCIIGLIWFWKSETIKCAHFVFASS